jgi:hypothetical protein
MNRVEKIVGLGSIFFIALYAVLAYFFIPLAMDLLIAITELIRSWQ